MQLDLAGALNVGMISIIFAFLFVDLFDTSGTLIGAAQRGGLLDKDGNAPSRTSSDVGFRRNLSAALNTTSYIESAAGISAGSAGLTAVVVALLFLACLLLSPIASIIPAYATAPALFYVAVLMASGLKLIDWDDITDAAPAIVTALTMPLTFSIANGIARVSSPTP